MAQKKNKEQKVSIPNKEEVKVPAAPLSIPKLPVAPESPLLKNIFFGSLLIMLGIFLIGGFNVGFHQDEMDMNTYCKANLKYYATGGKDTLYLGHDAHDESKVDVLLRYYGCAFEYLPVLFNKATGLDKGPNEFISRHIFIQIFAWLAVLFAGLIARRAGGWRAALFTIWLLFLTPIFFGSGLFNSKDIPFCSGYVAALYFILVFLEELPAPTWRTTIALMLAFAFTTGTRIGGILLIFFMGVFFLVYTLRKKGMLQQVLANFVPIALKVAVVVLGGMALVIVTWPYVLSDPMHHLGKTMTVVREFPMKIPMNFEGSFTDSLSLPSYYLLKMMGITIPVFILIAIVVSVLVIAARFKQANWKLISFVLFASAFPVLYAIASRVTLYSSWRHFLFIYPGLCVVAGIGLAMLVNMLPKPAYRYSMVACCALGMVMPVSWMVKNHPYAYCYFNELAGGYKNAYLNYETDYWEITMKDNIEWLMKHEPIMQSKDSVDVSTGSEIFTRYYFARHFPTAKVRLVFDDLPTRYSHNWHYAVFNKQYLSGEYLSKFFPPKQTVHTETIDGLAESIVIKDTVRLDVMARRALEKGNFHLSDSFLTEYFKVSPDNVGLFGIMAYIKAEQGFNDAAFKLGKEELLYKVNPYADYNALTGIALAYLNTGQYDLAFEKANEANRTLAVDGPANRILQEIERRRALKQIPPPATSPQQ